MPNIKLPATLENLDELMRFVSSYAKETGIPLTRIQEIELATEEALVNIFKYAYPQEIGDVALKCRADNTALLIEIRDQGIPFDLFSKPDPDLNASLAERKIGSLGIFFIKKMANEVQYRRKNDQNILTLVFHR